MITGVRHTGIVVQDIQGALKFWVNLFGAKVLVDQVEAGNFISSLLGLNDVSVRTVKLDVGRESIIELLNFNSHASDSFWEGSPHTTGLTHIALNVVDIQALTVSLEAAGYRQVNQFSKDPLGKVKVCYVKGFEGLLLELVQTL